MTVKFGNMTVKQFAERVSADMSDTDMEFLEELRTDKAEVNGTDKFHIFELPFMIECDNPEVFSKIAPILAKYNKQKTFAKQVQVVA